MLGRLEAEGHLLGVERARADVAVDDAERAERQHRSPGVGDDVGLAGRPQLPSTGYSSASPSIGSRRDRSRQFVGGLVEGAPVLAARGQTFSVVGLAAGIPLTRGLAVTRGGWAPVDAPARGWLVGAGSSLE